MSESAIRPAIAPREKLHRGGIPVGLATAAVLIAVVVVAAARYWAPVNGGTAGAPGSSQTATPGLVATANASPSESESPAASPTAGATGTPAAAPPSATPAATATAAPTKKPGPVPTSRLSGTPLPGDESTVVAVATKYQTYIKQGDYAAAWAMLAPQTLDVTAGYSSYATNWKDTVGSWGPIDFTLQAPTRDWQQWADTIPPMPTLVPGDYGRAFVIEVDYPWSGVTNNWNVLLIVPTLDGKTWQICIVR